MKEVKKPYKQKLKPISLDLLTKSIFKMRVVKLFSLRFGVNDLVLVLFGVLCCVLCFPILSFSDASFFINSPTKGKTHTIYKFSVISLNFFSCERWRIRKARNRELVQCKKIYLFYALKSFKINCYHPRLLIKLLFIKIHDCR